AKKGAQAVDRLSGLADEASLGREPGPRQVAECDERPSRQPDLASIDPNEVPAADSFPRQDQKALS
ncbi:MAG TPA: hypothetical protein VMS76_14315, partial [Planctomycetota bacterium]|nr:hypothetical protein [Planctomycetota bacterium]